MSLMNFIEQGGIIVYILLALNIVGISIIIWKLFTLPRKNSLIKKIEEKIKTENINAIQAQIEYEIKKLETGLTYIKNIATIAPLLGLLGTVIGVYKSFEVITKSGLGDPSVFSNGIAVALITTIAGLIVAIPHHLAYNHFISQLDAIELKAKKEIVAKV